MREYRVFESDITKDEINDFAFFVDEIINIVNQNKEISLSNLLSLVRKEYPNEKLNEYEFNKSILKHFFVTNSIVYSVNRYKEERLNLFFNKNNEDANFNYDEFVIKCCVIINESKDMSLEVLASIIKQEHNNILNFSAFKKFVNRHLIIKKHKIVGIKKQTIAYYNLDDNGRELESDSFKNKFTSLINSIDSQNNPIQINNIFKNYSEDLNLLGIYSINDFRTSNVDDLCQIIKKDINYFENELLILSAPYIDYCWKSIKKLIDKRIDDRMSSIMISRVGFFQNKGKTLEELGQEFNLTRERIRQIEARGKRIFESIFKETRKEVDFITQVVFDSDAFLTVEELEDRINDKKECEHYMMLLVNSDNTVKYESKYKLFYFSNKLTVESIEENVVAELGGFISQSDFNKCSQLEKRVISNLYSYNDNRRVYIKKNSNFSNLVEEIIYEHFPEGYRLYNEHDYLTLREKYISKYGDSVAVPSMVSIRGLASRNIFCQFNKGSIISKRRTIQLEKELMDRILNYIATFEDVIYYTSIFEKFRNELSRNGVNNRYYMKGLIDSYLPENYVTKRDYISLSDEFISSNESINKEIESFSGEFSISDLQNKYPGVKEYVFQVIMYDRDDVVWLSGKSFILIKNLTISAELKNAFIEEIEYLFKYLDSDYISSGKLFSRMIIMHEELMNSIPLINNERRLISLINVLFGEQYTVVRGYITKGNIGDNVTAYSLIEEYINNKSYFSNSDIKDYCEKMSIRGLYSFQDFMIDNSDSFVQISKDTCVKKELINITETQLVLLQKELDFYINSFGPIKTESLNNYSRFPKINQEWNKYLLVGVIRTFLEDVYEIEYTENVSTKTDYIIRRAIR